MASTFNPGAGGNMSAVTLPAAFAEAAHLLFAAEQEISADTRPGNINFTSDLSAETITVAATLPVTTALDANGQVIVTASDYLQPLGATSDFDNGSGELSSIHLAAALFEISQKVHAAEQAISADTRPNNLTVAIDLEASTAQIDATFPITSAIGSDATIVISVVDYL
ncbi:MAG: hypothetical protein F6J89_02155 [Symploca sp. SIO1C4]|uniref:Uncharacterized protein n=1 Tax=Symploca sp. SIO1C4 TaxID=2607765 RepID=A0A6B3N8J6_9CYAN|nr:hypothetical protein [Symploca sp. SIO1C4]